MLLYPCARAFRWSLHLSALKGDMDVSTLRLQVNHWKEKNQLRKLLAANQDELFEARRSLLRSNRDNTALSEQIARTRDSNQRLKGALKSAKVMMTSTDTSTVPVAVSKTVFIEDAVIATRSPDAAESATTQETTKSTSAESKAKPRTRTRVSKSETLQAYVEKFLAYEEENSTLAASTLRARRNGLMRFLDIVGYNVALKSLNADNIRYYRDMIHKMPANFEHQGFKIPRALSKRPQWFKETIEQWEGRVLGGGLDSHFKHVRKFLEWAQNEHYLERDFKSMIKASPKRIEATKKEVVNFMPNDLTKLFIDGYLYGDQKAPRDNSVAWQFWIPLIALYTGMRSEEIGALRLSSIVKKADLWCIQIEKSKTEAGVRTFPIPQRLLDAGLLNYRFQMLEDQNGDVDASLFPTLKMKGGEFSNRIGQFFNRNINGKHKDGTPRIDGYMFKCGVVNPSGTQTLKFHSFRHGFITKWLEARMPLDMLRNIVGHRGDFRTYGVVYEEQEGATEAYIHHDRVSEEARKKRLSQMKDGMDSMDFGVDLSGISYKRFLSRQ
ncbi:TPA: tyrosine-type recombinase/integrase [Vibrio parahaemolyticus]|nr:tyrosine-type recombinase/integrase [Vibrio parahaemolyticus]HCH1013535.1 tyrosine-type recombinase/integrase [Vibrio parahaemolyticus]